MATRRTRGIVESLAFAFPTAAGSVVLVAWAGTEGGYSPTSWYPGALFLLAVLALLVAVGRPLAAPRVARLTVAGAVAALAAFTAWAFASLAWADVRGDAWDGANRTLLYFAIFALFALWTPDRSTATFAIAFVTFGVAAVGVLALHAAAESTDPASFFIQGRFVAPIGYHNGDAALFLIAFVPALVLSSDRRANALFRASALAAAAALLALAVLPQSRATLFVLPLAVGLVLALVPDPIRLLASTAVVATAVALVRAPLLDVYQSVDEESLRAAASDARTAVLVVAAVAFLVGLALGALERRLPTLERPAWGRRGLASAAVVIALVLGAAALIADPLERVADVRRDLGSGQPTERGGSHFGSGLGSNRPDMWRVAWDEFKAQPLQGIGADNFAVPYVRDRRSDEEPKYPHSVALQVLSQFGIVGAALFALFAVCAVAAATRTRGVAARERTVAVAGVGGFAYWALHGTVDWLWEIPALGGLAFALLGTAVAVGSAGAPPDRRLRTPRPRLGGVLSAVALSAGALSLLFPWLGARYEQSATSSWRRDLDAAYRSLDRASRVNPLSDRPHLLAGVIAGRRGDWPRAEAAFRDALKRNPHNWYAELQLAVLTTLLDRPVEARAHLARARSLNPREPALAIVRQNLDDRRLTPAVLDRLFAERVRQRTS